MATEREVQAAEMLRTMKKFIRDELKKKTAEKVEDAGTDQMKQRQVSSEVAAYQILFDTLEWELDMVTNPGDVVWDPEHNYQYIFTGTEPYKHTNPLYYPGAAGVYHWSIIPHVKNFCKIYPNVDGIIVSVKQNEVWWNVDGTQQYKWVGVDNDNCVWPPVEGNEWKKVDF